MKRHIGTGKKVISVAWIAHDKAEITYEDFSKSTLFALRLSGAD